MTTKNAELHDLAAAEGLHVLGVVDAPDATAELRAPGGAAEDYRAWIARGFHGEMAWLARTADIAFDPSALLPGVRSVILFALNYYQRAGDAPGRGRIARYAWGRDYHKELGHRLRRIARRIGERYPHEQFRHGTDATPLHERAFAERAGLGFTARNTLTINRDLGSWFLIGEILTTRRWEPTPAAPHAQGACPGSCTRCIDVCPTGALYAPHRIDASRCISYLTIEHDGSIPEALRPLMGGWIFGCDLCQEVCPLNVRAAVTDVARFLTPIAGSDLDLGEVLGIPDDAAFTRRFAGSPLMRAQRRRLVRNATIAAANLERFDLLPQLRKLAADGDATIAEHAAWAVARLEVLDYHSEQ